MELGFIEKRMDLLVEEFLDRVKEIALEQENRVNELGAAKKTSDTFLLNAKAANEQDRIRINAEYDKLREDRTAVEKLHQQLETELGDQRILTENISKSERQIKIELDNAKANHNKAMQVAVSLEVKKLQTEDLNNQIARDIDAYHIKDVKLQDRINAVSVKEKELADRFDKVIKREMAANDYQIELNLRAEELKRIRRVQQPV